MKYSDYELHVSDFTGEMNKVTTLKNHDYSIREDAMDNFKMVGEILGISPMLVWSVLWMKHVTAIVNHMAKGKILKDETIHGRFIDMANYAMLGDALVKDLANSSPEDAPKPYDLKTNEDFIEIMRLLKADVLMLNTVGASPRAQGIVFGVNKQIDYILAHLEKFYHDQHGSPQPVVPVSRNPGDVQDQVRDQGADREPDARPDATAYSPHIPKGKTHVRNDELRGDRRATVLQTDRDQVREAEPDDRAVHGR